jgi:hypothetical protein
MILLIGGLITIYAVHRLKIIMPNKNSLKPNNSEANKPDTNIPLNNSNLKLTY